jgi:hypothetical protein
MDVTPETARPDRLAARYPASYRFTRGWRICVAIAYSALLCGAVAAIHQMLSTVDERPIVRTVLPCLIVAVFAAGTVWQLVIFLTWRATLTADAIETRSWWTTRRIRRDQVDGFRANRAGRNGRVILVVAARAGLKNIRLPLRFMEQTPALPAWFSGLRDLNAEDLRHSVAAILTDASFGTTPEQRLRWLVRARRLGFGLDMVTVAAVLWSLVYPQPYALVIGSLAAIPIAALVLVIVSRGLFQIGIGPNAAHANVGSACALPAFMLMVRVLSDFNLVDTVPLIGAGAAVGGAFVAILATVSRRLRAKPWTLLGIALITAVYGFGAIGEANALLDHSPASVQQTKIIDKRVRYGRATTYVFTLPPWGAQRDSAEVVVSHELYDRLAPGDPVCMLLHDGALGMPWFTVLRCR